MRVIAALKAAQDDLENGSTGYDLWIESLTQHTEDFATYKKKSVERDRKTPMGADFDRYFKLLK